MHEINPQMLTERSCRNCIQLWWQKRKILHTTHPQGVVGLSNLVQTGKPGDNTWILRPRIPVLPPGGWPGFVCKAMVRLKDVFFCCLNSPPNYPHYFLYQPCWNDTEKTTVPTGDRHSQPGGRGLFLPEPGSCLCFPICLLFSLYLSNRYDFLFNSFPF